jgi:hypothetical protein
MLVNLNHTGSPPKESTYRPPRMHSIIHLCSVRVCIHPLKWRLLERSESDSYALFASYHCGWVPLMPNDSDFGQNWKPRGDSPTLFEHLGAWWISCNPHTTQPFINQSSCTGEHVEIVIWIWPGFRPNCTLWSWAECRKSNPSTTDVDLAYFGATKTSLMTDVVGLF